METTTRELTLMTIEMITRESLAALAKDVGLASMVAVGRNLNLNNGKSILGETMEAYFGGLCLNEQEEELEKFINERVDLFLENQ